MSKVVTVHGHTLELDMGPSCPNPVGKWWVVANRSGDLHATDGDSGWQGMNNDYQWTSATDDVFKDCVIPATTFDKGPLQFEIDEQLNTTWYKE